jgi:tetratricopeptide (TPR) repeat protein
MFSKNLLKQPVMDLQFQESRLTMRMIFLFCFIIFLGVGPLQAKHGKNVLATTNLKAPQQAKQELIQEKIVLPEKTHILVARPNCISMGKKNDDKWFAALCETYLRIRIGSLKNVDVVASDSLFEIVPKYKDFSQEILPNEYSDPIARFHAAYALYPKYELMSGGKEFSFYIEVVRISDNKNLLGFEKIGAVENMAKIFDSCIVCMQKDAHIFKPGQFTGSFQAPLLGENGKNILKNYKQVGTLLFSENCLKTTSPLKNASALKGFAGAYPHMLLASYASGKAFLRGNDFAGAAELLSDFVKNLRDYASALPELCKSYRMAQKLDEALNCAATAENAGLNSMDLLHEKALIYQARAEVGLAGGVYATILKIDENDPNALRFCAWQNNEENKAPEALRFSDRLLKISPLDGKGLLERGRSLRLLKKYADAVEALRSAQTQLPDDPLPILYLGDVYRQLENFPDASACYEKAMGLMPADPYVCLKASEALSMAGNQKGALALLKKSESKFQKNSMFLKKMGLLEFQLADKENAIKHLEEFCSGPENDAPAFLALASLLGESGKTDKAIDLYTRALPLADDRNSCEMELAKLFLNKIQPDKALRHLSNILACNPIYDHVNKYTAMAYEMTGEKKKALAYYQKEQKLFGDKANTQKNLCALNYELGNMQEAEREYVHLIKTDTANGEAFLRLAVINLKKGKIDKADEYCSIGSRFGSGNSDVYFQIGLGYMNAGNNQKAIEYYRKSAGLSGKQVAVWLQLAALLLKEQNDTAAAEASLKVFDFDHRLYKDHLSMAAQRYGAAGKNEKAKALYDKYLEEGFTNPLVNEELAALEFKNKNYKRVIELQNADIDNARPETVLNCAESYCMLGQFDEALPRLSSVLAKSPNNRKALELCALAHEKLGDDKNALAMQQKLVSLSSGSGKQKDYAFHVGQLFEDQNQKEKAIRTYEKNIRDYPDDIRNYKQASGLYMADRNWSGAQGLLEKALQVPDAPAALRKMLAQSLAAQGSRLNAIAQYKLYLSTIASDSSAWSELGAVSFEEEHYTEAKDALVKAIVFMPKNIECLQLLGSCYMKLKMQTEAVLSFEKAHAINKNNIRIMADLAECYRSVDDNKKEVSLLLEWVSVEPQNFKILKECGECLLRSQRAREAAGILENACSLDSTDARVHLLLARSYGKIGKQASIFEHLEKATRYDPNSGEIQFEMGKLLNERKQYSNAQPYLQKAIALDSLNAAAHFEYSCLLRAQKNYPKAYEHADFAARLEPYNNSYLMQQVQTAYLCGKKDVSLEIIKQLFAKNPNSLDIVQWAGLLYKECGSVDSAKLILEKAITMSSSCASCYKNLGDIYRGESNYEKAIKLYGQALAVGTFDEAAALGLGITLLYSGDENRARQMFEKILIENSKCDEALFWNCTVYLQTGKKDKAKELFSNLSADRKSGWIHCIQGEIFEADGKTDEALISFTVAANLMPENPVAYAGAGRIDLLKQHFDKAIENFGKALARDQQNVQYLLELGKAYEGLGQNEAALNLYMDVSAKPSNDPDVYLLLGRVFSKQQDHQKSVDALRKGLTYFPKNAQLYYSLAHEYRLLTQITEAVSAYKKAISNSKDEYADAYRDLGDLYNNELKDPKEAKKFYQKYMKSGGKDEKVVQFVNRVEN